MIEIDMVYLILHDIKGHDIYLGMEYKNLEEKNHSLINISLKHFIVKAVNYIELISFKQAGKNSLTNNFLTFFEIKANGERW